VRPHPSSEVDRATLFLLPTCSPHLTGQSRVARRIVAAGLFAAALSLWLRPVDSSTRKKGLVTPRYRRGREASRLLLKEPTVAVPPTRETRATRLWRWWLDDRPGTAGLNSFAALGLVAGFFFLGIQIGKHGQHRLAGIEDALWIIGVVVGAQFAYIQLFEEPPKPILRARVANVMRAPAYYWKRSLVVLAVCAVTLVATGILSAGASFHAPTIVGLVALVVAIAALGGPILRLVLPRRFTSKIPADAPVGTIDQLARSAFGRRWAGVSAAGLILLAYLLHFFSLYAIWALG
jgi:hypothetical protein